MKKLQILMVIAVFSLVSVPLFGQTAVTQPTPAVVSPAPAGASQAQPGTTGLVLQQGTVISLELSQNLSSQLNKTGDVVLFKVLTDVVINGVVVIPAGTEAKGRVTAATPAKGWGKGGKLEISLETLQAIDGKNVPLTSTLGDKQNWAAGKTILGVALIGFAFGGGMKGKKVVIQQGTKLDVFVAEDTPITPGANPAAAVGVANDRLSQDCYKFCEQKSGDDFLACMQKCKECGTVCSSLPDDKVYECLGKCAK